MSLCTVILAFSVRMCNAYRILAANKIEEIMDSNKTSVQHKRYRLVLKQIRNKLTWNNLMVVRADKGRVIVIINKEMYKPKKTSLMKTNFKN
jgi:hypothetical protein